MHRGPVPRYSFRANPNRAESPRLIPPKDTPMLTITTLRVRLIAALVEIRNAEECAVRATVAANCANYAADEARGVLASILADLDADAIVVGDDS